MPRKPDERITQAKELYLKGQKLIEIASQSEVGKIDINGIATLQKRNATLRKQRKAVSQVTRMP